ncbi:hypothetical protein ACIQU6_34050 [Streptomyces sp. NPDC090442]|uniref:hypothetical protein n=1 Tax=Streptomyces sp. NPDC090442 TaxID=3365962 RepID=UPI0037F641E1
MTVPLLPTWTEREVVTATKLNEVRASYAYLADMPRLACRGYASGQTLNPGGARTYLRYTASSVNDFSADSDGRWFTASDSGIYLINAQLTVRPGQVQVTGDGVMLFIQKRAPSGAQSNIVTVRTIVQQSQTSQAVTACSIVHLVAGDAIGVAAYLDSGAKAPYAVQDGGAFGALSVVMVAPALSFSASAAQLIDAEPWTDGEHIDAEVMTRRITQPLQTLYSPSRFACRAMAPYSAASGERRIVPWRAGAFEESGGWTTNGTAVTAPASGLYLVSLCAATMRTGPQGPFGSYQLNLMRNEALVSLHQGQNTRSDYQASIAATGVIYLTAGDRLSVEFLGTGTGLTWKAPSDDASTRWGTLAAVMLGASASGLGE